MLRCSQLIVRLRNHYVTQVSNPWFLLSVNDRRVFYATTFNSRDNSTARTTTSSLSTDVASMVGHMTNARLENGRSPPNDQGLDEIRTSKDEGTHLVDAAADSPRHETHENTLDIVPARPKLGHSKSDSPEVSRSIAEPWKPHKRRYKEVEGTHLPQGPSAASADEVAFTPDLENTLGFIQNLVGATTPCPPQKSDFDTFKTTLRNFGPQLVRRMDASQSADLLCLLGTISDDQNASRYHSSQSKWYSLAGETFWEEVSQIAEMKREYGHSLGENENYWSTRAYLEQSKKNNFSASGEMAKLHFSWLSTRAQSEPSVLVPYLNILLAQPSTPKTKEALNILCFHLINQDNPSKALVDCFWRAVLMNNDRLSPMQKEAIIQLVLHRLSRSHSSSSGSPSDSTGDIFMGFVASLFPCYQKSDLSIDTVSWIKQCLRTSLAKGLSLDERFDNLILLGSLVFPQQSFNLSKCQPTSNSLQLRAIIGVAALDQSLASHAVSQAERAEVMGSVYSFSRIWRQTATFTQPRAVERAISIAFLRISIHLMDGILLDDSIKYIVSNKLCVLSPGHESEAGQVEQLFDTLADCACTFKGRLWPYLWSLLEDVPHSPLYLDLYLRTFLQKIANCDAELAYQFYDQCLSRQISVPTEASFTIAQQLASKRSWDHVTTILRDVQFDKEVLERLLETILLTFQHDRRQSTVPTLAEAIGDALLRCFSSTRIPATLKYPVRFFLPIMIVSHHPKKAMEVLMVLLCKNPSMFTARFLLRMIRTFLHHRHPTLAIEIVELAAGPLRATTPVVNDLVRKTRRGLIQAGARDMVLHPSLTAFQTSPKSLHDRVVLLATRKYSPLAALRLFPALTAPPVNGSLVLATVHILIQRRRLALAKLLMKQTFGQIEPQDMTKIGNAYLHAPLRHGDPRNGRLIQRILSTRGHLVQEYGFIPNRITVNIIVKALLRWKVYIDSRMVMSLFDHLVRNGYPCSEQHQMTNGVPFGTKPRPGETMLDLSGIQQDISFRRHVLPLYKMFIKALFLRKNARAAYKIIGILKEERALAMEVEERRERARQLGRMKKQVELVLAKKISNV